MGLAQAGEFGFVLLSFTTANNVIPPAIADQLLLVVALSMLLTPLLFIIYERILVPRFNTVQEHQADEITDHSDIIIAGHGRFGGVVNRMLRAAGYSPTVLDYSAAQLDMLRQFGFRIFFGDASRPDLLHAARIAEAKMLVVAIDGKDQITELVRYVCKTYPHVHVIARAVDRTHVYDLYAAGCRDIIRETFDSSVRAGRSAYEALGMHPFEAERLATRFIQDDVDAIRQMAAVYDPDIPTEENQAYIDLTKKLVKEREAQFQNTGNAFAARAERGWMPPNLADVKATQDDNADAKNPTDPVAS